jgi:hypothetical protein
MKLCIISCNCMVFPKELNFAYISEVYFPLDEKCLLESDIIRLPERAVVCLFLCQLCALSAPHISSHPGAVLLEITEQEKLH